MQNLFRRPSGIWVARLAVPARLRQVLGRHEFIQSTRATDPAIGKLIGSALLAGWRRQLLDADRATGRTFMDIEDETRWFSEYLAGLGMPRNGRKVFHSFRHNVATMLQNDLAGRAAAGKQLLSHARGSDVTDKTYRKDLATTGRDSELVQLIEGLRHDFLADSSVAVCSSCQR